MVKSGRKTDALTLPAGKADTALSDVRAKAIRQFCFVGSKNFRKVGAKGGFGRQTRSLKWTRNHGTLGTLFYNSAKSPIRMAASGKPQFGEKAKPHGLSICHPGSHRKKGRAHDSHEKYSCTSSI